MEKFTPLAKILHCRWQWGHGQIPPLKGPHVLNKASNLLVIYWKTKGIPTSDNSENHLRRKEPKVREESIVARMPPSPQHLTVNMKDEFWELKISTFSRPFSMNTMVTGQGLEWEKATEKLNTDIQRNQQQQEHFHQWVTIIKSIFILIVVKSKLKRNGRGFWKG